MHSIEQAVFTSAKTDRAQGYQLLGRSAGLSEANARELSLWGPSHGSLLDHGEESASTNFFTLESGERCVSRTSVAGAEYSGRGGGLVYTQFLVVPPDVMDRFANDPFAVLRAAAASGALCVCEPVPETLEPIALCGRAPVVDLGLMAQLVREPGPAGLAALVHAALATDRLAVAAGAPGEHLLAGLLNVLPVECRCEFSFTTGLKHSPSRPVRILSLPHDHSEWRAVSRHGVTPIVLENVAADSQACWHGWAAWVAHALGSGRLSILAAELEQPRPGLTCSDLNELGEQLLKGPRPGSARTTAAATRPLPPDDGAGSRPGAGSTRQRADAPHAKTQGAVIAERRSAAAHLDALADKLAEQPPEVLELLERIDDLVFAAISGDRSALDELEATWTQAVAELDADLVEQSREQYLRCALSICSDFGEGGMRSPERAVSAVDVLCVLFEE